MKIRIKIERTEDSEPSFPVPETEHPLDEEFDVNEATITMNQQQTSLMSDRPVVEIHIVDNMNDIVSKLAFLEWANCYWNEKQPQGSRLRKVTLKFYEDETKPTCYRSFVIPSAFLAHFEEKSSDSNSENRMSYEARIRSNDKKQNITFLPTEPS